MPTPPLLSDAEKAAARQMLAANFSAERIAELLSRDLDTIERSLRQLRRPHKPKFELLVKSIPAQVFKALEDAAARRNMTPSDLMLGLAGAVLMRSSVDALLVQWRDYLFDRSTAHLYVKKKKKQPQAGPDATAAVAKLF